MNPIKFYLWHNKTLPMVQHVIPLSQLRVLPPCQRSAEELPYQWRSMTNLPVSKNIFLSYYYILSSSGFT